MDFMRMALIERQNDMNKNYLNQIRRSNIETDDAISAAEIWKERALRAEAKLEATNERFTILLRILREQSEIIDILESE